MSKLMDIDELEDLAFRGAPAPDLDSMAQINLFQAFRGLYRFAASAGLTKEQGRREKQQILDAYRVNLFLEQLHESTADLWARIEKAATAYQRFIRQHERWMKMENKELLNALRRLSVQTGSLACLGCGFEHGCSVHGCAIMRKAVDELEKADGVLDAATRVAREYKAQRDAAACVGGEFVEVKNA